MDLSKLYNKKIFSHSGFRVYRLLLDIQNEQQRPTLIKASRAILMKLTGLSENSLKAAVDEILALGLAVIVSERPTLWRVNPREKVNFVELERRVKRLTEPIISEDETSAIEAK